MLKSTVITVTVVFISDHVNHRSKFCFAVNLTNNSTLNLLICLFLQRCIKRVQRFYDGLVSIYDLNCLFEGNAFVVENSFS